MERVAFPDFFVGEPNLGHAELLAAKGVFGSIVALTVQLQDEPARAIAFYDEYQCVDSVGDVFGAQVDLWPDPDFSSCAFKIEAG